MVPGIARRATTGWKTSVTLRLGASAHVVRLHHPQHEFSQQEYIGATADLKRRLPEHNAGKSSHTAKFRLLDEIRIQFVASCGSNLLGTQFNFVQYKSRGNRTRREHHVSQCPLQNQRQGYRRP
jgi:hypothetical protein